VVLTFPFRHDKVIPPEKPQNAAKTITNQYSPNFECSNNVANNENLGLPMTKIWKTWNIANARRFETQAKRFRARSKMKKSVAELKYNTKLTAPITTAVNEAPKARVHSREWYKIQNGDPIEINPSVGYGYKIMSVNEWSSRWKNNDDFPECLSCGSKNTKEHHFTQARKPSRPLMLT
jgi:hypothetical protein